MKLTIRALRINANMSRKELAEKLGKSPLTIHNWEKGKTIPDFESIKLIGEIFDFDIQNIKVGK